MRYYLLPLALVLACVSLVLVVPVVVLWCAPLALVYECCGFKLGGESQSRDRFVALIFAPFAVVGRLMRWLLRLEG